MTGNTLIFTMCDLYTQEYGSLAAAPLEIKARIIEMEQLSMNYVCVCVLYYIITRNDHMFRIHVQNIAT